MSSTDKSIGFGNILVSNSYLPLIMYDGNNLRYDSRVHSGDYFETLATELENISGEIDDEATKMRLTQLIEELVYIQERYKLTQKSHSRKKKIVPTDELATES